MPYISEEALYTDQSPLAKEFTGRVLTEGDKDARFVLTGKGGHLTDAEVEKYGLAKHKSVKAVGEATEASSAAPQGDEKAVPVETPAAAKTDAHKPAKRHK